MQVDRKLLAKGNCAAAAQACALLGCCARWPKRQVGADGRRYDLYNLRMRSRALAYLLCLNITLLYARNRRRIRISFRCRRRRPTGKTCSTAPRTRQAFAAMVRAVQGVRGLRKYYTRATFLSSSRRTPIVMFLKSVYHSYHPYHLQKQGKIKRKAQRHGSSTTGAICTCKGRACTGVSPRHSYQKKFGMTEPLGASLMAHAVPHRPTC
jgi:hypothetical protein